MSDITMCEGIDCPHKEGCYRFTAKPNEFRQSYFIEAPIKDGNCEYYWGENQINIWNQLKEIVNEQKENI